MVILDSQGEIALLERPNPEKSQKNEWKNKSEHKHRKQNLW